MADPLSAPAAPEGAVTVSVVAAALVAITASLPGRAGAAEALGRRYGAAVPSTGASVATADGRLLGIGDGRWLLLAEAGAGWRLETALGAALGDDALVTDQSDARVVFRLAGAAPALARFMERLGTLDLDAAVFGDGAAAVTDLSGYPAVILRESDAALLAAVPRSYAESFAGHLATLGARR